ncbi:hypothetical protein YC2023_049268 [Brassica napus]
MRSRDQTVSATHGDMDQNMRDIIMPSSISIKVPPTNSNLSLMPPTNASSRSAPAPNTTGELPSPYQKKWENLTDPSNVEEASAEGKAHLEIYQRCSIKHDMEFNETEHPNSTLLIQETAHYRFLIVAAIGVTASERKKNSDSAALEFIILLSVMGGIFNLPGLQASRKRLLHHHQCPLSWARHVNIHLGKSSSGFATCVMSAQNETLHLNYSLMGLYRFVSTDYAVCWALSEQNSSIGVLLLGNLFQHRYRNQPDSCIFINTNPHMISIQ